MLSINIMGAQQKREFYELETRRREAEAKHGVTRRELIAQFMPQAIAAAPVVAAEQVRKAGGTICTPEAAAARMAVHIAVEAATQYVDWLASDDEEQAAIDAAMVEIKAEMAVEEQRRKEAARLAERQPLPALAGVN